MATTCKPIPPPFPFPEMWERVNQIQRETLCERWLVPCFAPPPADFKITDTTGVPGSSLPLRDLVHDDFAVVEVDGLELNGAWAARFSKTIKRMKQKAHKAKRKASWLPKR
jgi:hypothetical protein